MTVAISDSFVTSQDGLKLHVREYGPAGPHLPVVCLPGLTRTVADFDVLAAGLAGDAERPRHVLALDSRGRGLSDYDSPERYTLPVELADLLGVLAARGIVRAVFLGSSRGGLLTMLLATQQPAMIAGAILNDIGPVIELTGLLRIKSYAGKVPPPRTLDEAAAALRVLFGAQFPRLDMAAWLAFARRTWRQDGAHLVPTYDVRLAETLAAVDADHPLPPLWEAFDALAQAPVMVIRGANSDLLSAETVAAMRARRPGLVALEVPDQGHTPLLVEPDIIARIAAFVANCDRAAA